MTVKRGWLAKKLYRQNTDLRWQNIILEAHLDAVRRQLAGLQAEIEMRLDTLLRNLPEGQHISVTAERLAQEKRNDPPEKSYSLEEVEERLGELEQELRSETRWALEYLDQATEAWDILRRILADSSNYLDTYDNEQYCVMCGAVKHFKHGELPGASSPIVHRDDCPILAAQKLVGEGK